MIACQPQRTLLASILFILTATGVAQVRLPALISNKMVLQQNSKVALWGWAAPGEDISITTGWNGKKTAVTAGRDGKWLTYVATGRSGGPYTILFKGTNEMTVEDVLLGEVWLSSGQSNMEFFVGKTPNPSYTGVVNYEEEIKEGIYPAIRLIDVANKVAEEPQSDFKGEWKVCIPDNVDSFSAVAYFFARKIHLETGFPIGIINATWGGTPAESWTKRDVLQRDADFNIILNRYAADLQGAPANSEAYRKELATWRADTNSSKPPAPREPLSVNSNKSPYKLYNGMINPLLPYTLRGIIWYQGESNADRAYQYRRLFPAMIRSWRDDFRTKKLPFYFVQISPNRSQNAEIREAQLFTYRAVPYTGIVVTTDNGDSLNIHPRNKKLVGERLALWALHNQYGKTSVVFSGPLYKGFSVEGNIIRIRFDNTDGGLTTPGGEPLKEFTIAGADGRFYTAGARIEKESVVVWSDMVRAPVAVRFAWKPVPHPNLFNKAGLPASPFRTDNRKGETEGVN